LTPFNALQAALAAVAVSLIVRRLRLLMFEAALDNDAFLDALETALASGQIELARRIAQSCTPAWPARLAAAALVDSESSRSAKGTIEPLHSDFVQAAFRGRETIATLGRMASPLALIGVILEIGKALSGGDGLVGLQRGLAMRIGLERSLLTFAFGLGTSFVCFAAVSMLQREALALDRALTRVTTALGRAGAGGGEM
jgi:hypothetical protein